MSKWNPMGIFVGILFFFIGLICLGLSSWIFGFLFLLISISVFVLSKPSPSTSTPVSHKLPPPPPPQTSYQYKLQKAAEMRNNPTPAERRMREILNTSVIPNFPEYIFESQSVQYGYILDFYCPTLRLAIEVDGGSHSNRQGYDWERDTHLTNHGIQVLRTTNAQVFNNPQDLVNSLNKIIQEKSEQVNDYGYQRSRTRSSYSAMRY
jgi:very-short-patch-repair endonuclease